MPVKRGGALVPVRRRGIVVKDGDDNVTRWAHESAHAATGGAVARCYLPHFCCGCCCCCAGRDIHIWYSSNTTVVRGTTVRSRIHNLYGILSTLFLLPAHVPSTRTAVQPYVYSARSIITAAAAAAGGGAAVGTAAAALAADAGAAAAESSSASHSR
jgi:hypothetical protein